MFRRWRLLVLVWCFAGWYGYRDLNRGWIPHDEGQFAEAADRVLAGQMPHRDFDEVYTGALTYLNAAAFKFIGEDLRSLRVVLFGFFLLWVPAVYYVASRFGSDFTATTVTALAVIWSIPNYPSPMPSWYNLFLAVFGLASMLRYLETDRQRWLFAAGLCGGLSFAVKLVGIYFVAGALLFLAFREQALSPPLRALGAKPTRVYSIVSCVVLFVFVALLMRAFGTGLNLSRFLAVLLPPVGVTVILIWRELEQGPSGAVVRLRTLAVMAAPFLAGLAVAVGLFLIPFAIGGGLEALYREVIILPQRRLASASYVMPSFNLWLTAPILLLASGVLAARRSLRGPVAFLTVGAALAVVLIKSRSSIDLYQIAWRGAVYMPAFTVLAAAWLFRRSENSADLPHQRTMLVVLMTAMCGLVQLPFPAPVYFCYVAPLAALSVAALFSLRHRHGHPLAAVLVVFYGLFVAFRVTPGYIYAMGNEYSGDGLSRRLFQPRAMSLRVDPAQAWTYDRVVPLVEQLARGGALYASPDCPEVYFLTGMPNPTRTTYEFLSEPRASTSDILRMLTTRHVTVVVINTTPEFSGAMPTDLRDALRLRFPETASVGPFEVRWID
jgi:hypothetical protein